MNFVNITYHPDRGPKESDQYLVSNCDLLADGRIGAVLQGSKGQARKDFDFTEEDYRSSDIERKLGYPTGRKRGETGQKIYKRKHGV